MHNDTDKLTTTVFTNLLAGHDRMLLLLVLVDTDVFYNKMLLYCCVMPNIIICVALDLHRRMSKSYAGT